MDTETQRLVISSFRGLAPLSFPSDWTKDFDPDRAFARRGRQGYIRFPAGTFAVKLEGQAPNPIPVVRRVGKEEEEALEWGPMCEPFEPYNTFVLFGSSGEVTMLDEVG